jgi:hypothetical protein
MPRLGDGLGRAPEQSVHQPAAVELALEPRFVEVSGTERMTGVEPIYT